MRKRRSVIVVATAFILVLGGCGTRGAGADIVGEEALSSIPIRMADIPAFAAAAEESAEIDDGVEGTETDDGAEGAETGSEAESLDDRGVETVEEEEEAHETLEELFGSMGIYKQILADNGEAINEEDKAEFLEMFGFESSEPFYVHTEDDGYALVELYLDEEREIGCAILDGENTGNYSYGAAFNCIQEVSWHYPDPFSVRSVYGTTGEEAVTDYRENYEYDSDGRLVHFRSTGTPLESPLSESEEENWSDQFIIDVSFTYDSQGKLKKKIYKHSSAWYMAFGTWFSWQASHYDERERLAHTASYVTHGSVEGYYIYQGESDEPAYFLELDHGWYVNFYRFTQKNNNWEFGGYRHDPNYQSYTYEIEPGEEEAFLAEQGYSEEDLFYEYEYSAGWDSSLTFRLSLYCTEDLSKGVGFIRKYVDGEYTAEYPNLSIFLFDGYENYLYESVDPFTVYSYYFFSGRSTAFLRDGMTLDEYYRTLEPGLYGLYFDYDEDGKLMHIVKGVTHGAVENFYIYRKGWNGNESDSPQYMLEVDFGWGVTFYRFRS